MPNTERVACVSSTDPLQTADEILEFNNVSPEMTTSHLIDKLDMRIVRVEREDDAAITDDEIRLPPLLTNIQIDWRVATAISERLITQFAQNVKSDQQLKLLGEMRKADPPLLDVVRRKLMMPRLEFISADVIFHGDERDVADSFSVRPSDVHARRKELAHTMR